ncbi:rRNA bioproteinsis protein rrp5 [Sporothrix curviconia]|uniref:rRNA bioproteinsis protein rrp5 n=1 Tax=Sporothrix curviconia TaxID=1260050 RepID=A0ABP0ATN3_9PEZI
MSSLKRKEASTGKAAKSNNSAADSGRPSKRAKGEKSGDFKKNDKTADRKTDRKTASESESTSVPANAGAAALVSRLKEDEPLFPRGGGSVLTPLEYKQIQVQAKSDALFDQHADGNKAEAQAKKKQKSKRKHDDSTAAKPADDSVKIESLNFKRLVKGSLVLGQVVAISPLEISVALPNNLVGHLPLTSISETLTKRIAAEVEAAEKSDAEDNDDNDEDSDELDPQTLFTVGEYIRVSVVSTEEDVPGAKSKRLIELSVRPEHANAGLTEQDVVRNATVVASVLSVEDRGYVMDLGIAGSDLRGFLAKKEVDASIPEERLQPGAVMLCLVSSKPANGKVAQLTTQKKQLGSLKSVASDAVTINTFLPGTAVDVLLSDVSSRGLVGKVLGHLDATADVIHSGAGGSEGDLDDKYKIASKVRARVICTFPTSDSPKIGVSVLSHIAALEPQIVEADGVPGKKSKKEQKQEGQDSQEGQPAKLPLDVLPLSSAVEHCTVRRVEPNVGLWVDVGVKGVPGFVHISRVKDGKIDALFESSGPFKVGSVHAGRVLGYNPIDGTYILSFEKSVLDQTYLRIEDVPVGKVVHGTVKKMLIQATGISGLIVEIADGITGLVPELHLADIKLQNPEKKFREGMKVKARVLSTDPEKHQIRLTLKKTLVNSDLPPVAKFDDLSFGLQCLGTIVNIIPSGAFIQFYGDLRGFLPVSEMSEALITNPEEHFRQGQVVSVRVRKFDAANNRLSVTCKDSTAFGVEKQLALKDLAPGQIVSATVMVKNLDGVEVELANSGLKATLPVGHLSDRSAAKNAAALQRLHVGQVLPELVVLDKHDGRRIIVLSQKASLIAASKASTLLTHMDDAHVGDMLAGFVRNITPTAVFIQFAAHIVALLPKQLMPLGIQNQPEFGLHISQSLEVRVVSVENERIVVSLQPEAKTTVNADDDASGTKLVNPTDKALKTLGDIAVGVVTKAKVTSVKATQLNVKLADNVLGRVDITEIFDKWQDIPDAKDPLRDFKENQIIDVRILGIHDARRRTYLPITQRSSRSVFELSAKPSNVKAAEAPAALTMDKIEPESPWIGFVNNRKSNCLWVSLSHNVRGRLYGMEASNDLSLVKDLAENFPIGTALQVHVLRVDAEQGRLDLSARMADAKDEIDWSTLGKNMVLPAKVTRVNERQVVVQMSKTVSGPVHVIDLADDYDQAVTTPYFKNDIVRVSVVSIDASNKKVRLSTRPSRVLNSSLKVEDREITSITDVVAGTIIRGFVRSVADKGLFVNLGGDVVAMVRISDLSDSYLKDWKAHFQVDQLVRGRVVSVNPELKQVQMTLKASVVDDNYKPLSTLADFHQGQIVSGRVRKVEDFGAFIVLDNTANVSGLCHRSEMADKAVRDARKLYKEGDVVKAKILSINKENGRVNLGLKPAYFDNEDEEEDEDAMSVDEDDDGALLLDDESVSDDSDDDADDDMVDIRDALDITGTDNDLDLLGGESDSDDEDKEEGGAANGVSGGLSAGGFDWSGASLDKAAAAASSGDEDDEDEGADAGATKKSSAKRKKAAAAAAHMDIDRTAELDISGPQTASDFERLLLGQPDSSALWIAYMAFQLQVSELAKARETAERAIKTINVREETERLNVWIAYLNLEVVYGTDETADEVFKRACQYNDQREVFERTASIYIQSGKLEKADEVFQTMTKKFGAQAPQIWINYAHFLHHSLQDAERARGLLPRAMQMLDKHAHVNLMARVAALEFRSPVGSQERGRTVFESLLAKSPKKFDLWDQLLDLETSVLAAEKAKQLKEKKGSKSAKASKADASVVRDVFERGIKVPGIKPRRAKTWFQRWAKWEEENGDAKSRDKVSARAREWAAEAEKKKAADAEAEESE